MDAASVVQHVYDAEQTAALGANSSAPGTQTAEQQWGLVNPNDSKTSLNSRVVGALREVCKRHGGPCQYLNHRYNTIELNNSLQTTCARSSRSTLS